jgi:predicted RecB family endonuclease
MLNEQAKGLMKRMQNEQIRELADRYGIESVLTITTDTISDLKDMVDEYLLDYITQDDSITTDYVAEQIAKTKIMLKQIAYLLECQEKVSECYDAELERQIAEIRKK